jgi:hypothetical protein
MVGTWILGKGEFVKQLIQQSDKGRKSQGCPPVIALYVIIQGLSIAPKLAILFLSNPAQSIYFLIQWSFKKLHRRKGASNTAQSNNILSAIPI